MELEWEFEKSREISDIGNELKKIVTNMFEVSINPISTSKYQLIYDTVTLLFEQYRREFESIIKTMFHHTVSEEYLELRRRSFIINVSIEVLIILKRLNSHFPL